MTVPQNLKDTKVLKHFSHLQKSLKELQHPISIELHPSNKCNLNCLDCGYRALLSYHGNEKTFAVMTRETLLDLVKQFSDLNIKAITISGGGDPSLNPYLSEFLKELQKNKIKYGVITNGVYLNKFLPKELVKGEYVRFSLYTDATPQQFFSTIKNIRLLVNLKNKLKTNCIMGIGLLVDTTDYIRTSQIIEELNKINISYISFRPKEYLNRKLDNRNWDEPIGYLKKIKIKHPNNLEDLKRRISELHEAKPYVNCLSLHLASHIDANGNVYPCCEQTGNQKYLMGNIYKNPFKEIWYSKKYSDLRNNLDAKKCPYCRYNLKNIVLHKALKNEINLKDFEKDIQHSHADFL